MEQQQGKLKKNQKQTYCSHMPNINPFKDPKLQGDNFFKTLEEYNFQCHFCDQKPPNVWICLNNNCYVCACSQDSYAHLERHCTDTKHESMGNSHSLFINPLTTQMVCVECRLEIFDFEQYCVTGNEEEFQNWCNPKRIREIFINSSIQIENQEFKTNLSNLKSHWKSNKGLCGLVNICNSSFINSIVQIFSNIPVIKKILIRITEIFSKYEDQIPKQNAKKLIFFLSKLIQLIWTGQNKQYRPLEFIQIVYQMDEKYKGYGFKDAYTFFQFILNTLHDEFKFFNLKTFDMRQNVGQINDIQEEWELIENISNYTQFSFISSCFKGKLCARVQCTQCKSIFWCEEDFMGVSLELLEQNERNIKKYYEWGILKKQPRNSQKEKNYLEKLVFGDSKEDEEQKLPEILDIYESIIQFCESENSNNEQPFSCDNCDQMVKIKKTYSFLTLPNVLTLQFQRFNDTKGRKNTTKVKFNLEMEFSYFIRKVELYEQQNTMYDLIGLIEHKKSQGGDKYVTYVKNYKNKMWYCYEDSHVKIIDIEYVLNETQPYILFYQLRQKSDMALARNLKSQIKLLKEGEIKMDPDQLAYLPCFWYEKYTLTAQPGNIMTNHLICEHQNIKPDYFDCFPPNSNRGNSIYINENSQIDQSMNIDFNVNLNGLDTQYALEFLKNQSVVIPKAIYDYLLEINGGGPIITCDQKICEKCIIKVRQIRRRRKLEKEIISKYDNKITEENFLVEEQWMSWWKEYLYSNKKFFKRNFIKGIPAPQNIQNRKLLGQNNQLLQGMKKNQHFRIVNEYIWMIFKKLYGASPALVVNVNEGQNKKLIEKKAQFSQADIELLNEMVMLTNEKVFEKQMANILNDNNLQNSPQQQKQQQQQQKQQPTIFQNQNNILNQQLQKQQNQI